MNFNTTCLDGCAPAQVINFDYAFNIEDIDSLKVLGECNKEYDTSNIQYAYSLDSVCWSCYMSYDDLLTNTVGLSTDFYLRVKINGIISGVTIDDEEFSNYTVALDSCFNFSAADASGVSSNQYNPYANMDFAISLTQQLTESVSSMFGIPIYYFKLAPNTGSKDITFKEYALMDVEAVKQIKLIVTDGQMPSSKPEFNDFGFEWEVDWECEISKATFATAFGNTAQPTEGDLIYIPMMKRMWMVNEAYEEKKDALMWVATTFKVALVKYQEKASVDLGETESLVNTFVKNKYEDLFGDQEPLDSGFEATDMPKTSNSKLYPIYESDATRKYITCDPIEFNEVSQYYEGTLITDLRYKFNPNIGDIQIIYQRKYCGDSGTASFIISPINYEYEGTLLSIGKININIQQNNNIVKLFVFDSDKYLELNVNSTYFVYLRWSKSLNTVEFTAAKYTITNENIPIYKRQPYHYKFDVDNATTIVDKWNIELMQDTKADIILHGFNGYITNIKVFDIYNDDVSEIMQMYPTNQHILVNDTARKLTHLNGVNM